MKYLLYIIIGLAAVALIYFAVSNREQSQPGGHHREGILFFEGISPLSSSVELKIKNVDGIPSRSFKWNIE